jgi:uncharacterized membrane protein (DUF485 family)
MITPDTAWSSIYESAEFRSLLAQRRRLVTILLCIVMCSFFAIPVFCNFWPSLFKVRLVGSINVGLTYLVMQYVVGFVVAQLYAFKLRNIDRLVQALKARAEN